MGHAIRCTARAGTTEIARRNPRRIPREAGAAGGAGRAQADATRALRTEFLAPASDLAAGWADRLRVLHGDERWHCQRRTAGLAATVLAQPVLAWRDDAADRVRRVPRECGCAVGGTRRGSGNAERTRRAGVDRTAGARSAARGAGIGADPR